MSASILVSGLHPGITKEKLFIHFQRRKNGGGDVKQVQISDAGNNAIIEFEDEKTVDTVILKNHELNGRKLQVERHEEKVFSKLQAVLSPQVVDDLSLIKDIVETFPKLALRKRHDRYLIETDSVEELQKFSDKVKEVLGDFGTQPHSNSNGSSHADQSRAPVMGASGTIRGSNSEGNHHADRSRAPPGGAVTSHEQQFNHPQISFTTSRDPSSSISFTTSRDPSSSTTGEVNTLIRTVMETLIEPTFSHQTSVHSGARRKTNISGGAEHGEGLISSKSPHGAVAPPYPQPQNGDTKCRAIHNIVENAIKRRFVFPAGEMEVAGQKIAYSSYECVISLPNSPPGEVINTMLEDAFQRRKLFYVGKNRTGEGFAIYSVYEMLSRKNSAGEVDLADRLQEVGHRLKDLGIAVPIKKPKLDEEKKQQQVEHQNNPEPMDVTPSQAAQASPKKIGPFPQPDGVVASAEFHDKDLSGFAGQGAIHIYFRFPGGAITTEDGQKVNYLSYNRVACLPGSKQGRTLYGMVGKAAAEKKLFVVAPKKGEFLIRTRVELLLSDDYPARPGYFEQLYQSLLKLDIEPPATVPFLPPKKESHYEEVSDEDEEFGGPGQPLKKGPHRQPENGKLRIEKEDGRTLTGHQGCGTINMYFRFAGGKMNIQGSKPSRSYEVQHSQLNMCASLPANNLGRLLVVMVKSAFDERKLFFVEKRDGEPSFRIRPHVTLLTREEYPKPEYLKLLRKELKDIGIEDPTTEAMDALIISSSSMPQGGAVDPNWSSVPSQTSQAAPGASPSRTNQGLVSQDSPFTQNLQRGQTRFSQPRGQHQSYTYPGRGPSKSFSSPVQPKQSPVRNAASFQAPKPLPRTRSDSHDTMKKPVGGIKRSSSVGSVDKEEEDDCAICLMPLKDLPTRKLPCKHEFHSGCVDMALKARQKCPMCQQPMGGGPQPNSPPQGGAGAPPGFSHNFPPNASIPTFQPRGFNQFPSFVPPVHTQPRAAFGGANATGSFGSQPAGSMSDFTEPRSLPGFEGCKTIIIQYSFAPGRQGPNHANPGARYDGTKREAYLPDNAEGRDLLRMLKLAFNARLTFTVGRSQSSNKDNQIIWNGIPHKTNKEGGVHCYGYPDTSYLSELRQVLTNLGIQ